MIEPLENRLLFKAPPFVTSIISDNRGEVLVTTSRSLDALTVNGRSVQMHTAGTDGVFGTADDVKISGRVRWVESARRISFKTSFLPVNTTYSFKLSAKLITGTDDVRLDGEFNGAGQPSGNGIAGGDLLFVSRKAAVTNQVARFSTVLGGINFALRPDVVPTTVQNFLNYANTAAWDGTFIHRATDIDGGDATTGGIVQGGGFNITQDNTLDSIPSNAPIPLEYNLPNAPGTISMARTSDPNSATNEWFLNANDNTNVLGQANGGGYAVFGSTNPSGLAVVNQILNQPNIDASSADPNIGGALTTTPVINSSVTANDVMTNPLGSLIFVRRVAILNKLLPFA